VGHRNCDSAGLAVISDIAETGLEGTGAKIGKGDLNNSDAGVESHMSSVALRMGSLIPTPGGGTHPAGHSPIDS